jgi:hypothetical protein
MGSGTADVVPILGDIGEMREEAEGSNDQNRDCRGQAVQCRFEVVACRSVLVSAEADRALANLLDDVEDRVAALLAYRVPKDSAEQPDVIAQREIFVVGLDCPRFRHEPTRHARLLCRIRASFANLLRFAACMDQPKI